MIKSIIDTTAHVANRLKIDPSETEGLWATKQFQAKQLGYLMATHMLPKGYCSMTTKIDKFDKSDIFINAHVLTL